MSTLPIDLQVLFTKAAEQSENLARQANGTKTVYMDGYEKIHKENKEAKENVQKLEQYEGDFTKTNPDGKNATGQGGTGGQKKKEEVKPPTPEDYKPAAKEEGTGTIIDIVD